MPLVGVDEAVATLRAGGLVGVPTETVYGLAAHGLDAAAVGRIYARKGRPAAHPVILHVSPRRGGPADARRFGVFDERAELLAARFWPGPLTLVLPRRETVPLVVTGGHPTVALRAPDHPVFQALIDAVGPLAAPSANRFGAVSPTTAAHVLADFPDLPVVDGGPCKVGVESTIVDLTGPAPALLRPGGIPAEVIEAALGQLAHGGATPAPGTLSSHYAPRAAVIVTDDVDAAAAALGARRVAVMRATDPPTYAATLYARLRALDEAGADVIVAEWCAPAGVGAAVNDRLRRAAHPSADPGSDDERGTHPEPREP